MAGVPCPYCYHRIDDSALAFQCTGIGAPGVEGCRRAPDPERARHTGFVGDVHPTFRTPWKSTILTGLFVASMAGLIPLSILAEMTSIGTLFAFVIVCGAVLVMRRTNPNANRPFRAPLVPLVPILGILTCLLLMFSLPVENWYRLIIWMLLGFVLYFSYGYHHSELRKSTAALASAGARRR